MEYNFEASLQIQDIKITPKQAEQLKKFYELLVSWNEVMNLTGITEENEVYRKHFYDSLTPAFYFDFTQIETLCDVGSGAGFPSFVLKIFFPHLKITIIEALEKRIKFLQAVVDALGLEDVKLVHGRAEEIGRATPAIFDVVTARAVARLPMLAELCIPLVKVGGTFIVLKGEQGLDELAEAAHAIKVLGVTEITERMLYLDKENDKRIIFFMNKGNKTPKIYPRIFGKIKKSPL
ncbi:ribosomal RNA small subunit methyltransferase G [Erysipelotrichaceae bacterium]|nr:ribosomal RNA small subunit methyltransferase G [Erysipelotrichaceae bacterium]